MDVLDNILQPQLDLLMERGYDEATLRSTYPAGWISERLQKVFRQAVERALYNKDPVDFVVRTDGRFREEPHPVIIFLDYRLSGSDLKLTSLQAITGDEKLTVCRQDMKKSDDLPHSSEIPEILRQQRVQDELNNKLRKYPRRPKNVLPRVDRGKKRKR